MDIPGRLPSILSPAGSRFAQAQIQPNRHFISTAAVLEASASSGDGVTGVFSAARGADGGTGGRRCRARRARRREPKRSPEAVSARSADPRTSQPRAGWIPTVPQRIHVSQTKRVTVTMRVSVERRTARSFMGSTWRRVFWGRNSRVGQELLTSGLQEGFWRHGFRVRRGLTGRWKLCPEMTSGVRSPFRELSCPRGVEMPS